MKIIKLSLALLLCVPLCGFTRGGYTTNIPSGTCPQGSSFADGCPGAPVGGSFQQANFFTSYAPQNGQTYLSRPSWNVAGVDYAVGYIPNATITIASPAVVTEAAHGHSAGDHVSFQTTGSLPTGIAAGTTYFVLATGLTTNAYEISTTSGGAAVNTSGSQSGNHTAFKDPTFDALPAGCSYVSASHFVSCTTGANTTFNYWDFSAGNGVAIEFASAVTGTVTMQNNRVVFGTNMDNLLGPVNNNVWFCIDGGSSNLVYQNNDINGQAIQGIIGPSQGGPDFKTFNTGTNFLAYNRLYNLNGRFQFGPGSYLREFNYHEGQSYNSSAHGEWDIFDAFNSPGTGVTIPLIQESFNTLLEPNNFGGGMTAPFFTSTGFPGSVTQITLVQVDHNTSIVNAVNLTGSVTSNVLTISGYASNQIVAGSTTYRTCITCSYLTVGTQITGTTGSNGTYNTVSANFASQTIFLNTVTAPLMEVSRDTITNVSVTNNYVDPTGNLSSGGATAFVNTGATITNTPVSTGNINPVTNGSIN